MDINKLESIQAKNEKILLNKANVVSVGYGHKVVDGKKTNDICLIVGVTKKVKKETLSKRDLVPLSVDGATTDVIEAGIIRALPKGKKKVEVQSTVDPTKKFRPSMPGISIGHHSITAGTFSCVVRKNGQRFILSNNHILAASNDAEIGDAIYQPGPYDGGSSSDRLAALEDFVPIAFEGGEDPPAPTCPISKGVVATANFIAKMLGRKTRLVAISTSSLSGPNYVDAAIARPDNDIDIIDEIVQIGIPTGIIAANLGMPIQKYGRTTQYTTSEVLQMNTTVTVSYGTNKLALFQGQIVAGNMSDGGDSGSAILDMNGKLTGLLFAGSNQITVFNPIQKVFELLGISL